MKPARKARVQSRGRKEGVRLLASLRDWFRGRESALVAFSGGTDSTLVLSAAADALGSSRVTAAIAVSETLPAADLDRARRTAADLGVSLAEIPIKSLDDPLFASNPKDRCYRCRKGMAAALLAEASRSGAALTADGSTADDRVDYRPGAKAMAEAGVKSPLAELGFTKADVRTASEAAGLTTASLASGACLASRIPYGEEITAAKLKRVDEAEAFLRSLGFRQARVRSHGDVARIEVEPAQVSRLAEARTRTRVAARLKELGFLFAALDLDGYRMGSMNEALK